MSDVVQAGIIEHFSSIQDPRMVGKTDHLLIDIIVITVCGVLCGADDWVDIENFGKAKQEWLNTFLKLPNGIPSHDTFGRVFARIDPAQFERCFADWVQAVFKATHGQVVAIDGKTLRRSHDRAAGKAAIHMVSAWASHNRITLGQVKTDQKSNEITAIPDLLDLLNIHGCIVSIDAMGCQTKIATKIVSKGGDYMLALKGNQGTLHDDIELFFEHARQTEFKDIDYDYDETTDGEHGRIEIRRCWTISDLDWLDCKDKWTNLQTVVMIESERHIGDQVTKELRYYISSLPSDAKRLGSTIRAHWGIENEVHWILDVAFREDDSRMPNGHSAQNFAVIRRFALNLLKQDKTLKAGIKVKRKRAGWDEKYLLGLLDR